MSALLAIRAAGFVIREEEGKIFISPASALSTQQMAYIKAHQSSIVQALQIEKVYQWLSDIGEIDPFIISEFISECIASPEKLDGLMAYIKSRSQNNDASSFHQAYKQADLANDYKI